MAYPKIVLLMVLAMCCISLSKGNPRVLTVYQSFPSSKDNEVEYDYRYSIDDSGKSGVVSDRWEQRYGEFVKGAYSLLEPTGKIRTVNYEVDGKRGFHATVKTSNPANVLLSNQQLEKYQTTYQEPFINIYSRKKSPPPIIKQLYKDPDAVPPNYHAIDAELSHSSNKGLPINNRVNFNDANYFTSAILQPPPPQFINEALIDRSPQNNQIYRNVRNTHYDNRRINYFTF